MRRCLLLAILALVGPAACASHASAPASPTPVATTAPTPPPPPPDPAAAWLGHWVFTSEMGGEQYHGTLDVSRDSAGLHAKLVEALRGELPVTSVKVDSSGLTLTANAGDPVTVQCVLQPDGTIAGKVSAGELQGTLSAKKE